MLVLGRKAHESITMVDANGDTSVITVTRIQNGNVRLAISAPETTKIMRNELLYRERKESEVDGL